MLKLNHMFPVENTTLYYEAHVNVVIMSSLHCSPEAGAMATPRPWDADVLGESLGNNAG